MGSKHDYLSLQQLHDDDDEGRIDGGGRGLDILQRYVIQTTSRLRLTMRLTQSDNVYGSHYFCDGTVTIISTDYRSIHSFVLSALYYECLFIKLIKYNYPVQLKIDLFLINSYFCLYLCYIFYFLTFQ